MSIMKTMIRRMLIPALLLALIACGGTPTSDPTEAAGQAEETAESTATAAAAAAAAENPYAALFTELEGLTGQERRDRLVELAEEEGATVQAYGANSDLPDLAQTFTDEYGIPVEVYRAQANQVLQRVLQEAEAGQLAADLIDNNGFEMAVTAREGLTVDYQGPIEAQLREGTNWDGWTANRFTLVSPVWNTEVLTEGPPAEFADMADERFSGKLLVEPRAFDWYMTLSTWFQENGMTEEQFDEMFRSIVRNSTLLSGNTSHVNFLASGEYGISAGTYHHLVDDAIAAGAPLARLPAVEPVVARPNGMALARTTDSPASTLLFFEWLLTDAQPLLVEDYRLPALEQGLETERVLEGIEELVTIDIDRLVDEGLEWEQRYQELLREAAGTVEDPAG